MFPNVELQKMRMGVTNSKIAKALKVTESTISLKLNGKSDIKLQEAKTIKELLQSDLPIEELFEEKE